MWALLRFLGRLVISGGITGFLVSSDSQFVWTEFLGAWAVIYALVSYFLHICRGMDEEEEKEAQKKGYRTVIRGGGCLDFLLGTIAFPLLAIIFLFYLLPVLITFLTPDSWDEPVSKMIQGLLIIGIICFDVYNIIKEFKKPKVNMTKEVSALENINDSTNVNVRQVKDNENDIY